MDPPSLQEMNHGRAVWVAILVCMRCSYNYYNSMDALCNLIYALSLPLHFLLQSLVLGA